MKICDCKILSNKKIAKHTYELILQARDHEDMVPGQFLNIKLDGYYLRRPLSLCDIEEDKLRIIYKALGQGTKDLRTYLPGRKINVMTGLGKGFDVEALDASKIPLLIGGGVGVPPLLGLAKILTKSHPQSPKIILGFNEKSEIFLDKDFEDLGTSLSITTVDGSFGRKGLVIDELKDLCKGDKKYYIFTCGPIPMLQAIYKIMEECDLDGQFSLEERMGCGFGACMGCSIETRQGPKRVCKEGPVFKKEDLVW